MGQVGTGASSTAGSAGSPGLAAAVQTINKEGLQQQAVSSSSRQDLPHQSAEFGRQRMYKQVQPHHS